MMTLITYLGVGPNMNMRRFKAKLTKIEKLTGNYGNELLPLHLKMV